MPCCRSHRELYLCFCVQSTWLEECLSQQKRVPEGSHLINIAAAIAQHIAGAHMAGKQESMVTFAKEVPLAQIEPIDKTLLCS